MKSHLKNKQILFDTKIKINQISYSHLYGWQILKGLPE
jgi:hypothetical protein